MIIKFNIPGDMIEIRPQMSQDTSKGIFLKLFPIILIKIFSKFTIKKFRHF